MANISCSEFLDVIIQTLLHLRTQQNNLQPKEQERLTPVQPSMYSLNNLLIQQISLMAKIRKSLMSLSCLPLAKWGLKKIVKASGLQDHSGIHSEVWGSPIKCEQFIRTLTSDKATLSRQS